MKNICVLVTILFISSSVESQITKGNWLVGGSARVATQKQEPDILPGVSTFSVQVSPNVGYFFANKFAAGLETDFSYLRTKVGEAKSKASAFGLGPFARYYFLSTDNRVNILAHSSYKYVWHQPHYREKTFLFSGGPVVYFNSSVGLETTINYQHVSNSGHNLSLATFFLGIGLQIHLEREEN